MQLIKNFIAIDLELNQPSGKIIEIGIAIGNPTDGIVKNTQWYVDPDEKIDESITELTGIDDATIEMDSTPLHVVAEQLTTIFSAYEPFPNPVQWGGSDADILRKEFLLKGIDCKLFGRREIDVKTIYSFLQISRGRSITGGLKGCMERYKVPFVGTPHRAMDDARNTLQFYFTLLNRQQNMERIFEEIRSSGC
jgi:inhibitor of KinA sporulation pathway (predicted exonuclease)